MKTESGVEMTEPTKTDIFLLRMAEVTEPITATEMRAGDRPLVGAQDKDKAGAMLSRLVSSNRLKRRSRGGENSGGPYEHLLPDVPWPEELTAEYVKETLESAGVAPYPHYIPHTDVPCSEEEKTPHEKEADTILDCIDSFHMLCIEKPHVHARRLRALAEKIPQPHVYKWLFDLADEIDG